MASSLLKPFEELVNRGVTASTEAGQLCRALEGRSLALDLQGLSLDISMVARQGRLVIVEQSGEPADCTIGGLPLSLLRLAVSGDREDLRSGTVTISGDPALARDFQKLLDLAKPDWEEELSRIIGDVAARQIGNLARGALEWGRNAATTLSRDVGEFLQEESRDLPTRFEIDEFLDDVDRTAAGAERAEARIARLERARSGGDG